ncbi:MAG: 50S ribosomal protein L6 [Halanaerobiales bacterium]
MSRIGKLPVEIPEKVDVEVEDTTVKVKGPKGTLEKEFDPRMKITVEAEQLVVNRSGNDKTNRSLHGMTRSIIESMIYGVENGYQKKLEMVGVGYSAQVKGKDLQLEVGYSHPVTIEASENIEFNVEKNIITVSGIDKQQVGDVAARIRAVRKPEPYKGKGIKYVGEHIRRKVGKTG